METAGSPQHLLRRHRLASGLTQLELADRAGVSRQLIAAVEAGQNTPAVDAGLRLAHALGTTVEALFSARPSVVLPAVGSQLESVRPLRIGQVGGRLVAAELPDHGTAGAGWARPDAVWEDGELRVFAGASPAGLVLAGCDPAIGVAESMLQGLGPRSLLAVSASTGVALCALAGGTIHAAVVHGPPDQLPAPPAQALRLHLARWQVGIACAPGLGGLSLDAVLEQGVRLVQRDPAAASQQALERALARAGRKPPPPGRRAPGHIEAARAAGLLGCAAVTTEAAAHAFELPFLGLEEHTVEVWVAEPWQNSPAVEALGELLASGAFTDRLSQFGGYELAGCGSRV